VEKDADFAQAVERAKERVLAGMSMFTFNLTVPPTVNNLFFNVPGKGRVKTAGYVEWLTKAGWELKAHRPPQLDGAVRIDMRFEDAGRKDLDGLPKAILDLLVTHQVIKDDSRKIVRKISLSWDSAVTGAVVEVAAIDL
jgi:crossover junction endodeoxyribonuclease RusA